MPKPDRRRKLLPPLRLGSPAPADPFAEMAAPSVAPHTEGAEIAMPMDTALAVEDAFGTERAQALSTSELAAWLDQRGLPYRWTMPR